MTTVLIGIWHDRVAVFYEDEPALSYSLELDRGLGTVTLCPDPGGLRAYEHEMYAHLGFGWRCDFFNVDREEFARCSMHELELEEVGRRLVGTLPHNHELPWPHVRECEGYDRAEELMRECRLRRASALEHGVHLVPAPPSHVQRLLMREMRLELFS